MNNTMKYSGILQVNTMMDAGANGSVKTNQVVALSALKGHSLVCTGGKLWVTVQGDPTDYILSENESLTLGSAGKFLLSGLKTANYRIR